MKTTLVFMAAGFGTRFGGGIKQIEPVGPNGEVLMDYAVHDALRAGFERVVFIIRRDLERAFREGVGRRTEARCDVAYVYQDLDDLPAGFALPAGRARPWGTGQAVLACRNVIDGPFCVLNADDYYGPQAFEKIHAFLSEPHEGLELCMAGYVLGNTLSRSGAVTRGLCRVGANGELESICETRGVTIRDGAPVDGELRPIDPSSTASMNIWGMPPAFIGYLQENFAPFLRGLAEGDLKSEYLLPNVVGEMVRRGEGRVRVLPTSDRWFGMTYAQDKLDTQREIEKLIRAGAYPERL